MIFTVRLTPPARRSLDRIPEKAATAIIGFLVGPLAAAPQRVGKPLGNEFVGQWSARVGPYRIVYEIDDVVTVVNVIRIGHRADVYR